MRKRRRMAAIAVLASALAFTFAPTVVDAQTDAQSCMQWIDLCGCSWINSCTWAASCPGSGDCS